MTPLIHSPFWRYGFLVLVVVLLLASLSLFAFKIVRVKMLPFDNKSEFQVIIDMPEGPPWSRRQPSPAKSATISAPCRRSPTTRCMSGTASPYNFNGLVRHYFLRRGPHVADIQVNLMPKGERKAQSHDIAKRVRPKIDEIGRKYKARIKVAEVPPGPPVLQTLVAEVYGPNYERQIEIARQIRDIFDKTPGVVDVDWYVEEDHPKYRFVVDKEKASLNGVTAEQISNSLRMAVTGMGAGLLHQPTEKEDVVIYLRLPRDERSSVEDLKQIKVDGPEGEPRPPGRTGPCGEGDCRQEHLSQEPDARGLCDRAMWQDRRKARSMPF